MTQTGRRRFLHVNDWQTHLSKLGTGEINLYELRQQCYKDIENIRGRPLFVYSSYFPLPPIASQISPSTSFPISIDLSDVDGFTDLIDSVDGSEQVDIYIHSPGGSPEATERIVSLLRGQFKEVTFLVGHSAYSAATMLALSGNEVILHPSASLGPIDPQINGVPARALRRGFDTALKALKEQGPEALPAYIPLIEKYSLELLEICEDYERLSKELVIQWLSEYMFAGQDEAAKIEKAVEFFASHDEHKTHSRSLTYKRIKHLGLNIKLADGELKSLLRETHILLTGFFELTLFLKVFENSSGLSWGRKIPMLPQQQAGSKGKATSELVG